MFDNSYSEYRKILKRMRETGRLCSFEEAQSRDSFIVLRHDIEFSIPKALQMALIERRSGVKSVYYVQTGNRAYNPFASENLVLLRMIAMLGHRIGLHYRQGEGNYQDESSRRLHCYCRTRFGLTTINCFAICFSSARKRRKA